MEHETGEDEVHQLLMELHRVSTDAENLIAAMPNVDTPAVEHSASRLWALRDLLIILEDDQTTKEKQDRMVNFLNSLIIDLENFLEDQDTSGKVAIC